MRILYVSAEVAPFAKSGGLADVAAGLPAELRKAGHDVRVITPCHGSSLPMLEVARPEAEYQIDDPAGTRTASLAALSGAGSVPVTLIANADYFGRPDVYGYRDDRLRFEFLCRTVARHLLESAWKPHVLHLNDWHCAQLAFGLRSLAWREPSLHGVASLFTIHNLRYRGPDDFNDLIAGAIYYADRLTTVSPTYAREILRPERGEGLQELLGLRAARLAGIINGIDVEVFDPAADACIAARFDAASLRNRGKNTAALRAEVGLPASGGPVAAMVTRLTEQKGVELVIAAAPALLRDGAQLVVLGSGDRELANGLAGLEAAHPEGLRFVRGLDDRLARRIYAGADMLLMPSRFEPCGLGQLIAMRYGCVPVARRTGGLEDTVVDGGEGATGFLFDDHSVPGLLGAWRRARETFNDTTSWRQVQLNGMARDSSWAGPASRYVEEYEAARRSRGLPTAGRS